MMTKTMIATMMMIATMTLLMASVMILTATTPRVQKQMTTMMNAAAEWSQHLLAPHSVLYFPLVVQASVVDLVGGDC